MQAVDETLYRMSLANSYHWRELLQVSFLSRQTRVCREKPSFVATKVCLPRRNLCRDKIMFVAFATKDVFCSDKHVFVVTKVSLSRLSRQNYVCRVRDKRRVFSSDKHMFVATKVSFVGTILVTNMFNATKVLSR